MINKSVKIIIPINVNKVKNSFSKLKRSSYSLGMVQRL